MAIEDVMVLESPVPLMVGSVVPYTIFYPNASKVESPSAIVYKNGTDVTSAVMVSEDSHVVSGDNALTLKKITALAADAGSDLFVAVKATVNGIEIVYGIRIDIVSAKGI